MVETTGVTSGKERTGDSKIKAVIYDSQKVNFGEIEETLFELTKTQFGNDPQVQETTSEAYMGFCWLMKKPDSTTALLFDREKLIGYSLAASFEYLPEDSSVRIEEENRSRTAYIYNTVIDEKYRGQKLVGKLSDRLILGLKERGFSRVARDCRIEGGYADNVERSCGDSIIEKNNNAGTPESGPQRFFLIDIKRYLENRKIQS